MSLMLSKYSIEMIVGLFPVSAARLLLHALVSFIFTITASASFFFAGLTMSQPAVGFLIKSLSSGIFRLSLLDLNSTPT